jgi:ornithine lipid ester-linked acyl 2-hydroxylase
MIMIYVFIFIPAILFVMWYFESRIFLVVFQKLLFSWSKQVPVLYDKEYYFPESKLLEENWTIIYDEVIRLLDEKAPIPKFHEVDPSNHRISFDNGPSWRTLMLKAFGSWFEQNCGLFPKTTLLLKQCPSVCAAFISILEPEVKIPEHTGKLKGIYRYHLGLVIPESNQCYLKLAGEKIYWKQGEGILFDDTFPHEVENQTEKCRIVLFLNVKKRMSSPSRIINDLLLKLITVSPIYKRALKTGSLNMD